jgi:membrane-bound serine protease (ClpP class)
MVLIALLAVGGLFLIFLEFFLPGMIFAAFGAFALLTSLVLVFLRYSVLFGLFYFSTILLLLLLVCKIALHWIKKTKDKDQFYLSNSQEGYVAAQFDANAVGKQGVAFTELKPSGHVLIDSQMQQALSERGYISKGTAIKVIAGKGGHLLVRELTEQKEE